MIKYVRFCIMFLCYYLFILFYNYFFIKHLNGHRIKTIILPKSGEDGVLYIVER